ncbi:MAG TPA: YtxH domain-containing protein [Chitinophagaceae bacterium]|nr:YtxH domain-containing protein [Chitinophagaceae bacterium]
MTDTGKMVVGMIAGAIAGISIGLLMAPEKGSVTRGRILNAPRIWVNRLGRLFLRSNGKVAEELQRVRKRKAAAQERVNQLRQGLG